MNQGTTSGPLDQFLVLWSAVKHYRGWVFLGTVLFSLAGFTYIFLLPNHYKATTTILVDPQKVPEKYVSPTIVVDPSQRLNTISDQVLGATRLQQIIDEMGLYPELRGRMSREEIVDTMRKDLSVKVKQGSSGGLSSFTIEYDGRNPQQVAQVANQLAASFIDWSVKNREQQSLDTTEFLDSQLKEAKQNLETQEKKVSAFKMEHLGEMPQQEAGNLQALQQLNVQFQANAEALNRLDVERTLLSRGLESAGPGSTPKLAPALTERQRLEAERRQLKDQLADLQRRYTDAHPEVRDAAGRLARVEDQLKSLPPDPPVTVDDSDNNAVAVRLQLIDKDAKRLNDDQARITAQIRTYRSKVDAVPVREQQMAELDRNYSVSKEHYQSLLDKTFNAQMAADLERRQQAEHFTMLDQAQVPEKPFAPKRRAMLPAAFLAALLLSVSLVCVKDIVNATVKNERELRSVLPVNVPVLTSIPELTGSADRRRAFRFAVVSVLVTVVGVALEAALYFKLHPIL
jgi:polysaccharide chain length determinant protein (PEP-CTERM system associated)